MLVVLCCLGCGLCPCLLCYVYRFPLHCLFPPFLAVIACDVPTSYVYYGRYGRRFSPLALRLPARLFPPPASVYVLAIYVV